MIKQLSNKEMTLVKRTDMMLPDNGVPLNIKKLGRAIQLLRISRGMTLMDFAHEVGWNSNSLIYLESGRAKSVNIIPLDNIARYCGFKLSALIASVENDTYMFREKKEVEIDETEHE